MNDENINYEERVTVFIDILGFKEMLAETIDNKGAPRQNKINALIDAINASTPGGMRNKAIIEVLYGCGLRVSELVNLKISEVYQDEGFIKVIGKGNAERLVPIGSSALKYMLIYLSEIRVHNKIAEGYQDYIFLNNAGKNLSRIYIFKT
ncbi:MAG: hypothetical protein EOO88_49070, partial [Pedobacter sp.]